MRHPIALCAYVYDAAPATMPENHFYSHYSTQELR